MEEDIKILEIFLKNMKKDKTYSSKGFYKHLKNLIKGYRELEEENRIFALAGSNIALKLHIEKNYIPKSKVKEKINTYSKSCTVVDAFIVDVLQELMEDK